MNFLVDENLTRLVVEELHQRGHVADKANHVGLGGRPDHEVWSWAFEHDQTVITANAEDFLKLARGSEVHAGLIVIRPGQLTRAQQWAVLAPVIERLEQEAPGFMLNRCIEVYGVGDYTWPPREIP